MEILIAEQSGFCFGVKRAVAAAYEILKKKGNRQVYIIGDLIHNPVVVNELHTLGIIKIKSLDEIENSNNSILLIRSHGISKKILKSAIERGIEVIDTTCPFVKKIEGIVESLFNNSFDVLMIGDKNHPEVIGLVDSFDEKINVVENCESVKLLPDLKKKIGIVVQTTQTLKNFKDCVYELMNFGNEFSIYNTICESTDRRQSGGIKLAETVDGVIVIGGKNSANTTRLFEICQRINKYTVHIESPEEINEEWLKGKRKIGITAGASTPGWIIEKAVEKLKNFK